MSSAGQAVGGIVGAVAGAFLGGPTGAMYGAQIGMMAGGYLDPPKGPTVNGPRLNDLTVQTSTYGAVIPRVSGTVVVNGNIFWLENNGLKETITKKKSGGKGGGAKTSTRTYSYSATFAVGLCKGPIVGVRRIWIGPNLIYDSGSSDPDTIMASNAASAGFAIYLGTDTQAPDSRMQATIGVANTPAWRGLAYIVFYDLQLAKYGNSLMGAQVRVEVMKVAAVYDYPLTQYSGAVSAKSWTRPAWNGALFCSLDYSSSSGVVNCMTSPDGETWTTHALPSIGETTNWSQVAASPYGTFIAVRSFNSTNQVYRSTDGGLSWPSVTLPSSKRPKTICYGNGTFVIIAPQDGKAFYSTNDGTSWSEVSIPRASSYWSDVYWCAGLSQFFVAYHDGYNSYVARSAVGSSWSETSIYASADWEYFTSIGSTLIMASENVSDGLLTTINGTSWSRITSPTYPCGGVNGIDSDGKVFLFLNNTGYWYSDDLVIYTQTTIPSVTGFWSQPTWNGSIFAIVPWVVETRALSIARQLVTPGVETLDSVVSQECLNSGLLTAGDIDVTALAAQSVRGYRIGTVGAIRSALEPLQASWPFDIRQHGYKIQFVARGGTSVVTIPQAYLDARGAGSEPGVQITTSREMDSQLPRRVTVQYLDVDREYNTGSQYADRLNTATINETVLDLPIVMTTTEAAGKAEVLLYLYWLERYDVAIILPPTYLHLEPGDVVTLVTPEGNVSLRLTAVTLTSDGRVECKAKYANAAIYTPTAIGASPAWTGPTTITPIGASVYVLLDVPMLNSAQSGPSFLAAMTGALEGWQGGVLMQSTDAGSTWASLQDFGPPGATMGACNNSIGTVDARVIDNASVLNVTLTQGDLYSVTQLAMLNGENHFAYGVDGRWEIIAAQNCTLVSGTTYVLTDLLRGRFGSEWAMSLHAAGDSLVLLDTIDVAAITMSSGTIGLSYLYRGITLDRDIDSDTNRPFAYRGVNLKPLSPVYLAGYRNASGDWSLNWIRRTRDGGEWRDYVDAALSEETESYAIDICSDGSYATVKRTITSSTPSISYSSSDQIADFGSAQTYIYFNVYQLSSTVGRGYPATATMVAAGNDPYWSNVVLLMPMTGLNGGVLFPDLKAHTPITVSGNAQTSTARSPLSIGSSALFDGTGDYISLPSSADWAFGTGDFTVEAWVYATSYPGGGYSNDMTIFGRQDTLPECYFFLDNATGKPVAWDGVTNVTSSSAVPINTWTFVQWIRSSGNLTIGINGTSVAYYAGWNTNFTATTAFRVGGMSSNRYMVGNISQLRVTKYARPLSTPTEAFPAY